jgi:hypothetical protein
MRPRPTALLLVLGLAAPAAAGPASDAIATATSIEAECAYLMRECRLGKAARDADPRYVEHPSGIVFGTTSAEATLHVGNAVEAAAAMRLKHGAAPACVAECDALLQR